MKPAEKWIRETSGRSDEIMESTWVFSLSGLVEYLEAYASFLQSTEQPKQEPSDVIQIGKKNGYITLIFPDNEIDYSQDHGFWRGLPSGVEFSVDRLNEGVLKLVAEGYGALKDNLYGLRYHYGNGAIYVSESILPEAIQNVLNQKAK